MTTFDQHEQSVETQYNVAGDLIIHQTPRRTIPLQRPPRAEHFVGREQELAQLLTDLQPGRVVTLCGPGGIGKSALAAEAVWTLAPAEAPPDRFPDGIIFHSFAGQPQAEIALETIARTFGQVPKPTPASAAQRALAGRRLLLLLDSAEDADDLPAVLAVSGGCGVLVTSRSRSDAMAERQDIEPLAAGEAVKLLQAWGRGQAADAVAVERISELVGRLPLAVRLAGRYLEQTGETAAEYLAWLEETPIEALSQGAHREENVAHLLEHSLAQVSETARQVLAVAGVLALALFDRAVIGAALELSSGEVRLTLNQLISYGLLRREESRVVVSHALIHTYARRRLAVAGAVVHRVAGYYTDLAAEQSKLGLVGYTRLDSERVHLTSILRACVDQEEWEAARSLAWSIDKFLEIRGYWIERITTNQTGLAAAQVLGDQRNEGEWLGNLGNAYRNLGQNERAIAYYELALTIAREVSNRREEGFRLAGLGIAYRTLGKIGQSVEYLQQALKIAQEVGDRQHEAFHLDGLGTSYRALGQVEQAIEYYEQALAIARDIGDRREEGHSLGSLGTSYRALGQVEQALEYLQQALVIAQEVGDRRAEYLHLSRLGDSYFDLGQMEKAIDCYQKAHAFFREIGARQVEPILLSNLGRIYRHLSQVDKAIEYYQQALDSAQKIGDRELEGPLLVNLGSAKRRMERYDEALADFDQVIELNPDIDWGYYERGLIHLVKNNPALAQSDLSRAIDLARQKYEENPQNWRNTLNLSLYTLVKGDTKAAKQLYQEVIDGQPPQNLIREAVDDLADFLKLLPDHSQAQAMYDLLQQHLA